MPIYEYRCVSCGHTFERLQSVHEAAVATCPKCDNPVEKIMSSAVGYVMKGTSQGGGAYRPEDHGGGTCCGLSSPCDNPKRCCGK